MITQRTTTADIECVLLARCGFSYKYIQQRTGLSKAQITRRLRQTNSQLKHYREGTTPLAHRIADSVHKDIDAQLKDIRNQLRQKLL